VTADTRERNLASSYADSMLDAISAFQGLRAVVDLIRAAREGRSRYVVAAIVATLLVGQVRARLERRRAGR